jgi:hypothetical protein
LVSPLTVIGDDAPVLLFAAPPLLDVHAAVYVRIGDPPSLAGGSNATVIEAFPRFTLVIVGASGAAAGIAGREGSDAALVPTPFVAVTVQV